MKKPMLLIQLIVNDSAVWQVCQTVDKELCRQMTQDGLTAVGEAAAMELENVLTRGKADLGPIKSAKRK